MHALWRMPWVWYVNFYWLTESEAEKRTNGREFCFSTINMAASIDPQMACRREHIEEVIDLISTQFLEMVPIRKMKWKVSRSWFVLDWIWRLVCVAISLKKRQTERWTLECRNTEITCTQSRLGKDCFKNIYALWWKEGEELISSWTTSHSLATAIVFYLLRYSFGAHYCGQCGL